MEKCREIQLKTIDDEGQTIGVFRLLYLNKRKFQKQSQSIDRSMDQSINQSIRSSTICLLDAFLRFQDKKNCFNLF